MAHATSIWSGYAAFCEESVGVAAEKVAAVVLSPVMDRIQTMVNRAERLGVEVDPETVGQIREGLAEAWRVVEQRGV